MYKRLPFLLLAKSNLKFKIYNLKLTAALTLSLLFFTSPAIAINLDVPFTPQAPYANWSQPWQDACEEAAIVMVDYFYSPARSQTPADRADQPRTIPRSEAAAAIRRAYDLKNILYGWSLDENADKIARWINDFYGWEAQVVEQPTIGQIKVELDAGRPIIAPVHGRSLFNPYFRDGGPDYHTLVISGYDDERREFIVQEPGTRHGLDFRYSYDRLLSAIHDYVPGGKTKIGRSVVIFTSQQIRSTDGTLVKSPASPAVYLLSHGVKRHIANEQVFLARGWQWGEIVAVSEKFLSGLKNGAGIN